MNMITRMLIVLFIAYVLQSTLAWLQIKRSYNIINDVKSRHQGEDCVMVTGTGRTKFLIIARGYFIILLVDKDDVIRDYYGMNGYTVFATPKQRKEYIGMTLDQLEPSFTKKNEKNAFANARQQLSLLREHATAE